MQRVNLTHQLKAIYYDQPLAGNKKLTAANPAIRIGG